MKKKTLAAASLLLALLMPLGATPLAVYAEGEDEAPAGVSTVSDDSEGTGETNAAPEGTGKTNAAPKGTDNTNGGSEADEPESEGKAAATVGIAPPAASTYVAWIGNVGYTTLADAVNAAPIDKLTEIHLGAGTYTLYDPHKKLADVRYKNLTFVGAGRDKTTWLVGPKVPDPKKFGTEYNSDYSFDVRGTNDEPRTSEESETVTFKGMTLQTGKVDYLGFAGSDHTVVEDCTIEGRTAYWGYRSAEFINTTFTAPPSDYAIWTYCSPVMTFDSCTFNASGKVINVYTDFSAENFDITVNFNNCTVNSTNADKTALSINDSLMTDHGHKFYVNITGNNTIHGLEPDKKTCSRLFGFGNDKINPYNGKKYDSGATVVTINDVTVWEKAQRPKNISHNGNDFAGTYDNGTGKGNANQYTEGYKDNAFDTTVTGWALKANTTNTYVRTITKQCQYCHEKIDEQEEKTGYRLRYDLNGGTGAEGTYNDTYYPPQDGNTATVAAAPSRAGYQFAGWQDANGKLYAAGDTVIVDHDITLTAQWNKLVTVSFDLCGHGGANISSQTFVSGNKASEPTAPKEDGWVFGGWYTEKGCKYRFSFDSAVTSDIILYAKWDRVTTVVSAPVATPTPTPSPAPAAAATKTATVKNAAIPQTSDAFPMEGLLALLAVGAVGFGAAGWLRKKHH